MLLHSTSLWVALRSGGNHLPPLQEFGNRLAHHPEGRAEASQQIEQEHHRADRHRLLCGHVIYANTHNVGASAFVLLHFAIICYPARDCHRLAGLRRAAATRAVAD